jgi:hypothetical protein
MTQQSGPAGGVNEHRGDGPAGQPGNPGRLAAIAEGLHFPASLTFDDERSPARAGSGAVWRAEGVL